MEYQVLEYESINEIEKAVDHYLNLGWEPQGGIAVSNSTYRDDSITYYLQALIKKEKKK